MHTGYFLLLTICDTQVPLTSLVNMLLDNTSPEAEQHPYFDPKLAQPGDQPPQSRRKEPFKYVPLDFIPIATKDFFILFLFFQHFGFLIVVSHPSIEQGRDCVYCWWGKLRGATISDRLFSEANSHGTGAQHCLRWQ
jgi:hypothetical protein